MIGKIPILYLCKFNERYETIFQYNLVFARSLSQTLANGFADTITLLIMTQNNQLDIGINIFSHYFIGSSFDRGAVGCSAGSEVRYLQGPLPLPS